MRKEKVPMIRAVTAMLETLPSEASLLDLAEDTVVDDKGFCIGSCSPTALHEPWPGGCLPCG